MTRLSLPPRPLPLALGLALGLAGASPARAAALDLDTTGLEDTGTLAGRLLRQQLLAREVTALDFGPAGSWALVTPDAVTTSPSYPYVPGFLLGWLHGAGYTIEATDLVDADTYVIATDGYATVSADVTDAAALRARLSGWRAAGHTVTDIAVFDDGWVALAGDRYDQVGAPEALVAALDDALIAERSLGQVEVSADGADWLVVADQWVAQAGQGDDLLDAAWQMKVDMDRLDGVFVAPGGAWVAFSEETHVPSGVFAEVEADPLGDGSTNLWALMEGNQIPGMSITLVDGWQVSGTRGYGVRHVDERSAVLTDTPFYLASVSKTLTGLAALRAVDGLPGQPVDLDVDSTVLDLIAAYGVGGFQTYWWWLTRPSTTPPIDVLDVRLDQFMSMTAGFADDANGSYPSGTDARMPATDPGAFSWLYGLRGVNADGSYDYPAGGQVWPDAAAGEAFVYANESVMPARAMLEDATLRDFETLMDEAVFAPLGMVDSRASLTLEPDFEERIAWGHRIDAQTATPAAELVHSPWMACGGMWGSSPDVAEALIVPMNDGLASDGTRILEQATAREMLRSRTVGLGTPTNMDYSFGLWLSDDDASDEADDRIAMNGWVPSRATNRAAGWPDSGTAMVILTNQGRRPDGGDFRGTLFTMTAQVGP